MKKTPTIVSGTTRLKHDLDSIVGSLAMGKWKSIKADQISDISEKGGVYVFTLPEKDRHWRGSVTLYGRTFGPREKRRQLRFKFIYRARCLEGTSQVILYIGKAANLRDRLKSHHNLRDSSTTSQMLNGMAAQDVRHGKEPNKRIALDHLLAHATVYYYELGHEDETKRNPRAVDSVGKSFAADRDLLEIKLIAKYAPPYNIKAER